MKDMTRWRRADAHRPRGATGNRGVRLAALACALLAATAAHARDFSESVPARPGGKLELEVDGASVVVESHDLREVRLLVRASGFGADSVDYDLESDDGDVKLDIDAGGWTSLFGDPRLRILVRVPRRYSVEVKTSGGPITIEEIHGDVRAETSGGAIEIDDVRGKVELRTSGGPIEASDVTGELRGETSGGSIRLSDVRGKIDVETSGGRMELLDVSGPVKAKTSGGPIEVRFTGTPEGRIETSGGGITVGFPEDAGTDLEAKTSGGKVSVEHPLRLEGSIDPSHVVGRINGGGPRLQLETSGGNIAIEIN